MSTKLILRLVLAIAFAALAVIFSELLPPITGTNPFVTRVFFTLLAATVGFIIFPDVATRVSSVTVYLFNFMVNRVSSEILNQLLRMPRQTHLPFFNPAPHVGWISLQRPLILDTSALIDGRILDIAQTGFVNGLLLIPNFILIELQHVSD